MEKGRLFPNKLKKFRHIGGYSQKRVARFLQMKDTSTISRWEQGIATPSIIQIFRLSQLYNLLPHELYKDLWECIASEKENFSSDNSENYRTLSTET